MILGTWIMSESQTGAFCGVCFQLCFFYVFKSLSSSVVQENATTTTDASERFCRLQNFTRLSIGQSLRRGFVNQIVPRSDSSHKQSKEHNSGNQKFIRTTKIMQIGRLSD